MANVGKFTGNVGSPGGAGNGQGQIEARVGQLNAALQSLKIVINDLRQQGFQGGLIFEALSEKISGLLKTERELTDELEKQKIKFKDNKDQLAVYTKLQGEVQRAIDGTVNAVRSLTKEQIAASRVDQNNSNQAALARQESTKVAQKSELDLLDIIKLRLNRERQVIEAAKEAYERAEARKKEIARLNAEEIEKRELAKFKNIVAAQKQEETEAKKAAKAKIESDLQAIRSGKGSARKRLELEINYLKEVQKRYKEGSEEFEKLQKRIIAAQGKSRDASFLGGLQKGFEGAGLGKALGQLTGIGGAVQALRKVFGLLQSAITGSFKAAVDFEAQLAQLQAVTGINNEELNRLKKNVLDVAGSTKFTSEEIVQLQSELGKLGFSVTQIEAATLAVARTAQALGEKVGPVAQRIGQILNQFNLNAAETTRVSDSLVSVINSSALSFEGFSTALQYIGPLGAEVGTTFEETAVAMALLADNGFTASRIGTGLRGILTELSKTGKDLNTVITELADEEVTLAEAVDLVGKRNAAQLITLVDAARRQKELGQSLDDLNDKYFTQGSAAIAASQQVNTFQGNLDLLKSAINRVQIAFGEFLKTSKILRAALRLIDEDGYAAAVAAQAIAEADPLTFSKGLQEASESVGKLKQQLADTKDIDAAITEAAKGIFGGIVESIESEIQAIDDRKAAIKEEQKAYVEGLKERADALEAQGKIEDANFTRRIVNNLTAARQLQSGYAASADVDLYTNKEFNEAKREYSKYSKEIADNDKERIRLTDILAQKERELIPGNPEFDQYQKQIAYVKQLIAEGSLEKALEIERNLVIAERSAILKSLRLERSNEINDLQAAVDFNKKAGTQVDILNRKINGLLDEQNRRKENGNEIVGDELLLFEARLEQYKEEKNAVANLTVTLEERNALAQKEFEKEFKRLANLKKSRELELANKQALLDIDIKTQENLAKNAKTEGERLAASEELARLNDQRLQNEIEAFNDLDNAANEFAKTLSDMKGLFEEAGLDGSVLEKAQERLEGFRLGFQGLNIDYGDLAKQTESLASSLSKAFKESLSKGIELSDADRAEVKAKAQALAKSFLQQTLGVEFPEVFFSDEFEELSDKINQQLLSLLFGDSDKSQKDRKERIKKLMKLVLDAVADAAKAYNDTALENTKNRLNAELDAIRNRYKTEEDILKSQLDNQLITESQFRTKKEELRKKELQEQNEINRKIFQAEKKADLNNIAIEAAEAIASNLIENFGTQPTGQAAVQSALGYAAIVAGAAAKADAVRRRKFFPIQFEEGGLVTGPSHSQGGVPFTVQGQGGYEMEGGEFIVNKKAAAFHRSLLERINGSYKPNTNIQPMQFAQGGLVEAQRVTRFTVNAQSEESVNYLKAIAHATISTATDMKKPTRAFITSKDLSNNETERRLKERNDRI